MKECCNLHQLSVELVPGRHSARHALRWVDSLEQGLEAAFCNHVSLIGGEGQCVEGDRRICVPSTMRRTACS